MAQEALNSSNNINLAHNVSLWFRRDYAGNYTELGDLVVDGVTLSPEFAEHRSYRNGINALRKRMLTNRSASISATLNEPNALNLERVVFGSATTTGGAFTVDEGKHLSVTLTTDGPTIDLTDASETDFANITVIGVYAATDVLQSTNLIGGNLTPDTDGVVLLTGSVTDMAQDDIVYVRYQIAASGLMQSEIFGASDATIEGDAKLQARNLQGGVVQLWDLASVNLAPNGDIGYAVDAIQTVPILLTLQERSGTFGRVYTA